MDTKTVQNELKTYLLKLEKHITVSKAILFGSLVENKTTETSDVDLIIISPDFKTLDPDDRSRLLYRTSVGLPYDLHLFGLTPQEFENASSLTSVGQIKQSPVIFLQ